MAKRILFFSGGSYISGLEIVTLQLMAGLKNQGYDIRCIFSGWNDGNFKKKLDELSIVNYEIKLGWIHFRKPLWTLDSLLHYPKAYYQCKNIINNFKPDVCHFCNFGMPIMLYNLIPPNSIYNLQETHHPNAKHNFIYKLLNKKIMYFTAVSKHISRVLINLKIPSSKIKLIYNGITVPSVDENYELKKEDKSFVNFAVIGQIVLWKGHLLVVDAVEILIKENIKNFKVAIYGNDNTNFAAQVKSIIQSKGLSGYFEWKGFVNNQSEIYRNCEVVLVPSQSGEPCSLTVIESMAQGKALIVSDNGGNPELITNNVNGLIFNNEITSNLSYCMKYFINDKSKITDLGNAAKIKANLCYTRDIMTSDYVKIYNIV